MQDGERSGVSRRDMLRGLLLGGVGLVVGNGFSARVLAAVDSATEQPTKLAAKAKSVIQIWMAGGLSHLDTFDPKPDAGNDYCGPFARTIPTNVGGIQVNEMIPLLARQADKYSILRGMTHGVNAHETASYMVQTGNMAGDGFVHPCVGAVVSLKKGYDAGYSSLVPPYIVTQTALGRFSEAGFLGSRYQPFATGGDPNKDPFLVEGIVAEGISEARQKDRRDLMHQLDSLGQKMKTDPEFQKSDACEEQSYELIFGDAGKVFDLSKEAPAAREQYGRTTFGQSCLLARRLVERGVPFISINYRGWDTHKQHFNIMRRQLPEFDKGFSTLLQDLSDRGLLDSTLIWCSGEFGRTPKIQWESPWNGGRGHYGNAFSTVVAGGGFKPGCVVGATNARGEEITERPIYPWDLTGSIYELAGIDPDGSIQHPQGQMVRLTPVSSAGIKSGGRLTEIM